MPTNTPLLRIRARKNGFRRCGVPHPAEATDHSSGAFTPEQVEILKNEPMLVVEEIAAQPDPSDPAGSGGAGKPPGSQPPTDPAERQAAIVKAIGGLDAGNKTLFMQDGRPKTEALAEKLGWPVTAGERNAAVEAAKQNA